MLETFAEKYGGTTHVNIVNTPIELVEGRTTVPPAFLLPGLLRQFPEWEEALDATPGVLTLYDQDNPFELKNLGEAKERFAGELRRALQNVLAQKNPMALVAQQESVRTLDSRWRKLTDAPLLYKVRGKNARQPRSAATLFADTEWVFRSEAIALTVARPWEDGKQTLEAWRKRTFGEPMEWRFMAGALRDGDDLHQKGLLFMDWGLKNVVVSPRQQTGRLFDYEAAVPVGAAPFLISEALRLRMEEDAVRFAREVRQEDDLYTAAQCVRELKQGHSYVKQMEVERIASLLVMGNRSLKEAADLLDNLAI